MGNREESDIANDYADKETKKYIIFMCKKCKFYNRGCTKKRLVRECAKKGLKNK